MNKRDLELMESLKHELQNMEEGGVVVLDVNCTQFVRTNLILLQTLLGEMDKKGLFISVDRPHQYMVHLMKMHHVDTSRVAFIDAISRFSADRKQGSARVGILEGPFNIDDLPKALMESGDSHSIDPSQYDFAIIDNLAGLLLYNNFPKVERFFIEFVKQLLGTKKVIIPVVIDAKRDSLLYETAKYLDAIEVGGRRQENGGCVT
jgi:hypothetical protein